MQERRGPGSRHVEAALRACARSGTGHSATRIRRERGRAAVAARGSGAPGQRVDDPVCAAGHGARGPGVRAGERGSREVMRDGEDRRARRDGHDCAFVLGGGGALGAYEVGMLQALFAAGVRPGPGAGHVRRRHQRGRCRGRSDAARRRAAHRPVDGSRPGRRLLGVAGGPAATAVRSRHPSLLGGTAARLLARTPAGGADRGPGGCRSSAWRPVSRAPPSTGSPRGRSSTRCSRRAPCRACCRRPDRRRALRRRRPGQQHPGGPGRRPRRQDRLRPPGRPDRGAAAPAALPLAGGDRCPSRSPAGTGSPGTWRTCPTMSPSTSCPAARPRVSGAGEPVAAPGLRATAERIERAYEASSRYLEGVADPAGAPAAPDSAPPVHEPRPRDADGALTTQAPGSARPSGPAQAPGPARSSGQAQPRGTARPFGPARGRRG